MESWKGEGGPGGGSCLGKSVVNKTVEPSGDRRTMGGAWLWETYLRRVVRSSCEHKWPRARWGTPLHSSPGMGCRHAPGEPCRVSCLETPWPRFGPLPTSPSSFPSGPTEMLPRVYNESPGTSNLLKKSPAYPQGPWSLSSKAQPL